MRLTEERLEKMIKDELDRVMSEAGNVWHDEKGHFTKKKVGAVYSMSKKGAKSAGISPEFIDRGIATSVAGPDRTKRQLRRNSKADEEAGRQNHPAGKAHSPVKSVSKFPQPYKENFEVEAEADAEVMVEMPLSALRAVLKALLDELRVEAAGNNVAAL